MLKEADAAAKAAAKAFKESGTSAGQLKFRPFKYGMMVYTEQRLAFLKVLDGAGGES